MRFFNLALYLAPRASRIPNRNLADSRQHLAFQDRELLVEITRYYPLPARRNLVSCDERLGGSKKLIPFEIERV